MPTPTHSLLSGLRMMVAAWRDDPRDDAELLTRFAEARDEAAFTVLVGRHGPLVWRTCERLLGDTPDAEDAFQAAFLALARKAGLYPIKNIAGWLHQVARRLALDIQTSARCRQSLEQRLRTVKQPEAEEGVSRAELYAALDEELVGLPERLRVPLLLHYIEGRSQVEVARLLGCGRSVLQRRLTRGEAILRERLERRGLAVGIGSVAALLTSSVTTSAVPARLIGSTARAAVAFRSGTLLSGAAEAARAVLGAFPSSIETTIMRKSLWIVLACCLGLGGAALVTCQALSARPGEPAEGGPSATQTPVEPEMGSRATARVDCYGDPLPVHALARMGTTRLWPADYPCQAVPVFSPNGKMLASPTIDGMMVCLWDATTGQEIRRLTTKTVNGLIGSLGFSPDGKTLVTVYSDRTVCRWKVATGKLLHKQEYQGPKREDEYTKVVFLPGGKMLGMADCQEGAARGMSVWDVATGKEICRPSISIRKNARGLDPGDFSPDGKLLATARWDFRIDRRSTIFLCDVATGKEIRQLGHKKDDGENVVTAVAFSRDGKTLASKGTQGICLWEVATGKKIRRIEGIESLRTYSSMLAYSPDSKTLIAGEEGSLFDVSTGKEIRSFGCKDPVRATFSPDGKILAIGDRTMAIRLWEIATGKEIGPRKGYRAGISSIAYSADGKTLASMGGDETIRLWEVATGKEMRPLAKQAEGTIAYSPDGKMLVSSDAHDVIRLRDTTTGKEIRQFEGSWWRHGSAALSPDGKRLATGANCGPIVQTPKGEAHKMVVYVWDVATGKNIYTLPTGGVIRGSDPWSVAFSPDGQMLAAPGKDNTVSLWEVATSKPIGQLGGLKKPAQPRDEFFVRSLAFSPDGRMLAVSGKGDEKIRLWEVATGKEIRQLNGRLAGRVGEGYTLAFSLDGRMLATAALGKNNDGSFDPKVHLWEVASGKEIGQLAGHQEIVRTIAFSPGGKILASGSDDLTCLVWDVTPFMARLKPVPAPPPALRTLSKEQLGAAWSDLAKEPAKAYPAIWTLQAVPTQAIALLQARVRPVAPPADRQQLQRWIADLDDNRFTIRKKAQREIGKLGEAAVPALRQALKDRPSAEARRRLKDLLAELEPQVVVVSARSLRELRAVRVLESIGTTEAWQMLQALAKGVVGASLTMEAEAALARLAKHAAAKP